MLSLLPLRCCRCCQCCSAYVLLFCAHSKQTLITIYRPSSAPLAASLVPSADPPSPTTSSSSVPLSALALPL
ncbi:uncharacterized protein ASCRUDRAFT_74025 [Ascoidea rubescens DSM 1968]|uniref:Uncharacterized protein n=1 Tax=Ascoidea rubescens DSM 1968 TaxID=1344418 RepID=A0A1D2VS14_9ASCO|nr:hypothetical protein ASCRUDRAFT_74025 [Ascoidea rubescens DSM 1968]ODV64389.1 hypothetical protein ASCRUDRAFT_74025 [Ascoidea rubescens DSM 1968]